MSDSFFQNMNTLRILDLSYASIEQLPNSMSNLEKLNALVLRGCRNLRYLPSLEKLKELRKLDLHGSGIEKVPHGLEMLVNLTYLDLVTKCLQELPIGTLSKLFCLQYLVLCVESITIKMNGLEAARLRRLETFEGRFNELIDFNTYCKSMQGQRLTSYLLVLAPPQANVDVRPPNEIVMKTKIRCSICATSKMKRIMNFEGVESVFIDGKDLLKVVGEMDPVALVRELRKHGYCELVSVNWNSPLLPKKVVILSGCQIRREDPVVLPTDLRCLQIFECHNVRSLSDNSLFFQQTNELKLCLVRDCREMESVLDLSSSSSSCALQNLQHLWLERLDNLQLLVKVGEASVGSISSSLPLPRIFSHLKSFQIERCSNMKKLFPFELVNDLQNLEKLAVGNCGQMEEIIASKEEEENHKGKGTYSPTTYTLPKLEELELKKLPKLKSICSLNGVIICDSLEEIVITECPNLNRMPLNLPLFQDAGQSPSSLLKRIYIDSREWWKSVEWDYPSAKNILQPFLVLME